MGIVQSAETFVSKNNQQQLPISSAMHLDSDQQQSRGVDQCFYNKEKEIKCMKENRFPDSLKDFFF